MATNNIQMTEEELRRLGQSLSRLVDSADNARQAYGPYADALRQAGEEQNTNTKKVKEALKQLASDITTTSVTFTKSVLSSEEGLGKFGSSVEGAAGAAAGLAGAFGPLGFVLGSIIKLFGQVAAASLKQNDALMKAYRDFADVGNISGSIEKLQSDLYKFGLTSFEADKLAKILKDVSPALSSFGGSVSAGTDRFAKVFEGMIGVGNKTEQMLGRLGYSTQDMREATADYIARQSRLGLAQNKTTDQLRQESVRYMGTLAELRELTGMSRDEAQKALDQQMKDARWAMTLREIEATDGKDAADRAAAGMVAFEKKFGSDAAMGLMEQIANKGAIVGEASARISRASLDSAYNSMTDLIQNRIKPEQMISQVAKTSARNLDALRGASMIAGEGLKDMTGDYAFINGVLGNENTKTVDVQGKLRDSFKNTNDRLAKNIELEQNMRQIRIAGDMALKSAGDAVVGVFETLMKVMMKFAKFMASMIDKISNSEFGKKLGMSPSNLSAQFRDETDVAEDSKEEKLKKNQLGREKFEAMGDLTRVSDKGFDSTEEIRKISEEIKAAKAQLERPDATPLSKASAEFALFSLEKRRKMLTDEISEATRVGDQGQTILDLNHLKTLRERRLKTIEEESIKNKTKLEELEKEKIKYMSSANEQAKKEGINPFGNQPAKIGTGASAWNTDEKGQSVSPEIMEQRQAQQQDNTQQGFGRSKEILSKLNFGGKDKERTGGGEVDPALLGLAEKISEMFPGSTFTAMNDLYHKKNNPKSKHTVGKALDFALPNPPKDANEANEIRKQLKNLGATKVLDEYFSDKNGDTTGGHFHLEVAKMGGLFKGPDSGYPVELHGKNESVWPEQKLQGLLKDVEKSSIEKYKQDLMDQMGLSDYNKPTQTASSASGDTKQMEDLFNRMINRFDTLISLQDKSNNISDELLTYTRA